MEERFKVSMPIEGPNPYPYWTIYEIKGNVPGFPLLQMYQNAPEAEKTVRTLCKLWNCPE